MTNSEFLNTYIMLKGIICLSDKEIEFISKSNKVNIQYIYNIFSHRFKDNEDIIWKCSLETVKLCNRHKMYDVSNVMAGILNTYDTRIGLKCEHKADSLEEYITKCNNSYPLSIEFNVLKIVSNNRCMLKVDGVDKIESFSAQHFYASEPPYLKSSNNKYYGCIIRKGIHTYYYTNDKNNFFRLLKDILRFNYDLGIIPNILPNNIELIDKVIPKNTSTMTYINILLALGIFKLTASININQFNDVLYCKMNLRHLIKTVIALKDITDVTKANFLIKVVKTAKNEREIERVNQALCVFIMRIKLNTNRLTKKILGNWSSIKELIRELRILSVSEVYMICDVNNPNNYCVIYCNHGNYKDEYILTRVNGVEYKSRSGIKHNIIVKNDSIEFCNNINQENIGYTDVIILGPDSLSGKEIIKNSIGEMIM